VRRTVILAALALASVLAGAVAFSLADHVSFWLACYWSLSTASTVGYGDVAPRSGSAHVIAVCVMLTAIPLLGACFASLTAMHVHRHVREHVDRAIAAGQQADGDSRADARGKDVPP
jgi:voltage-gated potassium channel